MLKQYVLASVGSLAFVMWLLLPTLTQPWPDPGWSPPLHRQAFCTSDESCLQVDRVDTWITATFNASGSSATAWVQFRHKVDPDRLNVMVCNSPTGCSSTGTWSADYNGVWYWKAAE